MATAAKKKTPKKAKVEAPPEYVPAPPPGPIEAYMIWDVTSPPFGVTYDKKDGQDHLYRLLGNAGDEADLRLVKVTEVK